MKPAGNPEEAPEMTRIGPFCETAITDRCPILSHPADSTHRLRPTGEPLLGPVAAALWLEAALDAPLGRDFGIGAPEASAQARQIGGAERCGFGHQRSHYRDAQEIGLTLQHQTTGTSTTIDGDAAKRGPMF